MFLAELVCISLIVGFWNVVVSPGAGDGLLAPVRGLAMDPVLHTDAERRVVSMARPFVT